MHAELLRSWDESPKLLVTKVGRKGVPASLARGGCRSVLYCMGSKRRHVNLEQSIHIKNNLSKDTLHVPK